MDYEQLDGVLGELEAAIGYPFKNRELLKNALTHTSFSNEMRSRNIVHPSNERLEFLGDSILSFEISRYIYNSYPDLPEGSMSKIRAVTVCEKTLSDFSKEMKIGRYLLLGKGEESNGGRNKNSLLADAFEAVLAAIYLDGGEEAVKSSLLDRICKEADKIILSGNTPDHKTALQQIVQQSPGDLLDYVVVEESGPMNNRHYRVEARLNSNVIGRGFGRSKKEAEQAAAGEALKLFGQ